MNKRLMRFPEGKKRAVTLSYDDSMEADKCLIDMMEKYGLKGTFNLIPGWFAKEGTTYPEGETYRPVTAKMAEDIYDHPLAEVSNHGYRHKYMSSLTTTEMAEDMILCRKSLEQIFERHVTGMAYPYGWYDDRLKQVLKICGIKYSRTVDDTYDFDLPEDWLEWHPTCHHDYEHLMDLAQEFLDMKDIENPRLFYVWGHTFEFERNDNWDHMEQFMKKISGYADIWYATNGEIYKYVEAYKSLEYSADGTRIYNPTKIPVWVEVDGTCYEVKDELVIS